MKSQKVSIYYNNCDNNKYFISHSCIIMQVWPYLLGYYTFSSTPEERDDLDTTMKCKYEETMSEWLAVEAIVKQRDKETLAANLVKISQESTGMCDLVL